MRHIRGITLIALIVTIIVLLILAGISIMMLTGENSILQRMGEAGEKTQTVQEEELRKLTQAEAMTYLEEHDYEDPSGEKVTIPAGCAVSQVEGESTLEDGLVIIDENGNEWVWIEVSKREMPEGLTFIDETDYTILEKALQTYANTYRESGYADEWYDGCGLEADEYNILKKRMLKSVYENGGFYIGKYEVGSFDAPVTAEDITRKAVIQKGAYPYNFVICSQAEDLVEGLATEGNTSTLMFGIQWDLILKYLETSGVSTSELKTDSGSWGNYKSVEFSVSQGNKYLVNDILGEWADIPKNYTKPLYNTDGNDGVLLSTGATERNSKRNIYDLAGNLYEFTLEKSLSEDIRPCSLRGGVYNEDATDVTANYRGNSRITSAYNTFGFRPTLY